MANRFGLDVDYFRRRLGRVVRDLGDYTPMELARELEQMVDVACSQDRLAEQPSEDCPGCKKYTADCECGYLAWEHAEQPDAPDSDLPLIAWRQGMPQRPAKDIWHVGGKSYLVADIDEYGLPVIPRTADMEGAKYRWKLPGGRDWLYEDEFLRQFKNYDYQRIEDYQPSAQENRS